MVLCCLYSSFFFIRRHDNTNAGSSRNGVKTKSNLTDGHRKQYSKTGVSTRVIFEKIAKTASSSEIRSVLLFDFVNFSHFFLDPTVLSFSSSSSETPYTDKNEHAAALPSFFFGKL